jgi:hypothetical protein
MRVFVKKWRMVVCSCCRACAISGNSARFTSCLGFRLEWILTSAVGPLAFSKYSYVAASTCTSSSF